MMNRGIYGFDIINNLLRPWNPEIVVHLQIAVDIPFLNVGNLATEVHTWDAPSATQSYPPYAARLRYGGRGHGSALT